MAKVCEVFKVMEDGTVEERPGKAGPLLVGNKDTRESLLDMYASEGGYNQQEYDDFINGELDEIVLSIPDKYRQGTNWLGFKVVIRDAGETMSKAIYQFEKDMIRLMNSYEADDNADVDTYTELIQEAADQLKKVMREEEYNGQICGI